VLWFVRYGLGTLVTLAGIVVLFLNPSGFGVDGFALGAGAGLSIVMFSWLFRLGVSGEQEREREEAARRYLDEHGYWPDEAPADQPPHAAGER
jgi:hypothetical protein